MNQKIRELAEQAGLQWCIQTPFDQTNMQEFAELIVSECIEMADQFELEVNRSGLVDRIKHHFGVE